MFKKILVTAILVTSFAPQTAHALTSDEYTSHKIVCQNGDIGTATRVGRGTYVTAYHTVKNCGKFKNWSRMNVVKYDVKNDIAIVTTRKDKLIADVDCKGPQKGDWLVMSGYAKSSNGGYTVMYGEGSDDTRKVFDTVYMKGDKASVKGMSGGPVVDMTTDKLVGIVHGRNTKHTETYVIGMDKVCPLLKKVPHLQMR